MSCTGPSLACAKAREDRAEAARLFEAAIGGAGGPYVPGRLLPSLTSARMRATIYRSVLPMAKRQALKTMRRQRRHSPAANGLSHAKDRQWWRLLRPRARLGFCPVRADSNCRRNYNSNNQRQNRDALEIAQTAILRRMRCRCYQEWAAG